MSKKPQIGDIFEISTRKGLVYAQYTHQHPQYGGLIRVFEPHFETRPTDTAKLVHAPVRFSTFFPVAAAIKRSIFQVVAHDDVSPQNRQFPLFRAGVPDSKTKKVVMWWLWDGQEEWMVGSLTSDQRCLPIREVLNDTMLVKRIEDDWTPSKVL